MATVPRRKTQGPQTDDPEAILASYPPELFGPRSDLDVLLVLWTDHHAAEQRKGLKLLARAGIREVPPDFDGRNLMLAIHHWKRELREWEIGPEPPAAERDALQQVESAVQRLALALNRLVEQMSLPGSRIAGSVFTRDWPRYRINELCGELASLRDAAASSEVAETMRREGQPRKPKGGWSAREGFFGHDLPHLYKAIFRRRFTASGKADARPSEGVRFASVVATEVLGYDVRPETVVKQRGVFRAAVGGRKRGQE
jgi:hypothetical protein